MRLAVIGTGSIGRLHARLLSEDGRIGELIVADQDRHRAAAVATETGARSMEVGEALAVADALVIAAVPETHAPLIRAGLGRRIPVFCEKPLAADLADSARLVAEVDAAGTPFQLGFQRRYDPAYREARRCVESGEIGRLYQLRMTATDHEPPPDSYPIGAGNYFRDSSIHDFDATRFITGSEVESIFVAVAVLGFPRFASAGDLDTVVATLRMRDGTLVSLAGGRHNPRGYDIRMELGGSRDALAIGLGPRTPIRPLNQDGFAMEAGWDSYLDRFEPAYRAELRAFVEIATGQSASACTARDGLEAMRVAAAATRSQIEGRLVALDEITAHIPEAASPNGA